MATGTQHEREGRSPWSRPGVLISGAFLLLLALAGIVIAILASTREDRRPASAQQSIVLTSRAPTSAIASNGSPARAGSTTGCDLPVGDQTVPIAAPPEAQWNEVGSMETPQNPSIYGPERTDGIWNTCFAHDPTGALFAAMNFWAEGTAGQPAEVLHHLAIDVPARLAGDDGAGLAAGGPVQIAGYRFLSYTPPAAQLAIVLQGPQGKLAAVVSPMRWVGGDWRFVFPPGGRPAVQTVPDFSGYVAWSAF
jgi:hypothetical protein